MELKEGYLPNRTYYVALLVIVAVGLALRLAGFGSVPPGLYHDEAYNGLDALRVLREGWRPLWFPANNGREPLYIYMVALSVGLFGRTAAAVRGPSLLFGVLTVPAAALMATALFNRRVGLLTAAVTAVTLWPVHLSHMGFRTISLPFFTALALGFLWRGLRGGRLRDYVLGGLFYGACFYTYLPARATPVALLALAALLLMPPARLPRPDWRKLALFALIALVAAAPLAGYLIAHPEAAGERTGQVSILNPEHSHGNPWGTLAMNTLRGLGIFFVQGDPSPRQNLPYRPVFDPLLGAAFVLGVVVALRRRGAGWFVLLWVAILLAPTLLAETGIHFLRSSSIQPLVFVLPALGLDAVWRRLEAKQRPALGAALAGLALLVALASTTYDYFGRYAPRQDVYYQFEAGTRTLAERINRFLAGAPPGTVRRVSIPQTFWDVQIPLHFLVQDQAAVHVATEDPPGWPAGAGEALLLYWPGIRGEQIMPALPPGSEIIVTQDLAEQRDREPAAHPLIVMLQVGPARPVAPLATLEHGITLDGAQVEQVTPLHWRVRLRWGAAAALSKNYSVFVHAERGAETLGQHDSFPANGLLPTSLWRAGDRIEDVHEVALSAPFDPQTDRIVVGLYDLETMARLRVQEATLPVEGDALILPAP